ncbi:hypothetical protein [Parathalassolituus penaei]|uniref:Uncharacterized protein n=1 Tax=Parathalassolituus penaei TaxID=2997323 RepID=A0A9X3ECL2_9GAMM|nr:hypothetical protein [Parathalassolituus penaei]MCY0965097.1 hypothetical protein [Parathalassolituus penaei]
MHTITSLVYRILLIPALIASAVAAYADALDGNKSVFLIDKKGEATQVGTVAFSSDGGVIHYQLKMDHHGKFKDYFLSMKEMKCLEGPELMCHLSYPYQQPHTVSADDLSWLSHDLLFMFKQPTEFGANFWNGVYYDLTVEDGVIKGTAQAVDLNRLASPPADLTVPPFAEADRDELEITNRWLPYLEIR